MNHTHIYNLLISKATLRDQLDEKFEIHHIIPRSIGGSNDKSNLVKLTLKEHFIAHLLLSKIYGGSMNFALFMMSNFKRFNSRKYSWTRCRLTISESHRKKISISNTGKKRTDETKKKMSDLKKGIPLSKDHVSKISKANTGSKRTAETKKKQSEAQQGRIFTTEHKQKLTDSHKGMTGKTFSDESKNKMSESQLSQPEVTCPHCGKTGKGNAMHRWHFDHCSNLT